MKKLLILCLILTSACKTFSQVDSASPNASVKTNYLKKSKTQKTVAWVLLGTGTAMTIGGVIAGRNGVDDIDPNEATNGAALIVGGIVLDIASIPFFISGAKNKQRAMAVTLKNDFVPHLQQGLVMRTPLPTISVALKL